MGNVVARADSANIPSIVTTTGDVLAADTSRRGFGIQNVGQVPVFIRLATGASTTVFHRVIKGGTADSDGLGGSWDSFDGATYAGIVSATVASGTMKIVITTY